MTKNKPNLGINSPYRQFGCFYEKNIKNYLASCEYICSNSPMGTGFAVPAGNKLCELKGSKFTTYPLYPFKPRESHPVHNPDFKWEEPTKEEYCEWYFKRYGKEKA